MESLESKLDRLTPEQRKEVEDFVDFLMYRSGNLHMVPGNPEAVALQNASPPPLILQEPVHLMENPPMKDYDSRPGESSSLSVKTEEPAKPIQEIIVSGEERISRDYMDYGQFEQTSSPAINAVRNVKEKLKNREEQEKPRVSLDWID